MTGPAFAPEPSSSILTAVDWINDLLLGSLATGVCVLAVAAVGAMMLLGRVPFRSGFRVILGCFVLLGAPVLASAFLTAPNHEAPPVDPQPFIESSEARMLGGPSEFDPYAGASLRRD